MSTPLLPGRFFLPGPTEVRPDVLAAQTGAMIGHRGRDIEELMGSIQDGLQAVFLTERPVVVSTSSATGLMEAAVRNGVAAGRVLNLVNGAFSSRFAEIALSCGREIDRWAVGWGEVHDPDELAERLEPGGYQAVTLSHSETSTGALQDLRSIAEVVSMHEETLLLVDSVTGIGGVETRTDDWGIDFILTGSQKALAMPPGLAFGVASSAMMERAASVTDSGWYFSLPRLMDKLEVNQTPATPAISLMYALDTQLRNIVEETMERRWRRHEEMQQMIFDWVDETAASGVGAGVFATEGNRSPTVTCVTLPEGVEGPTVVRGMRDRGWVVGGGYGKLKQSTFRIGHMGDHTTEELGALLDILSEVLA